ncbi:U3 small nucleolar RNA-associated protein 18-like protein [Senna tora]|uniref:U3 small nucleolar RNA-associated protein 18 homolog n=1 Tax=Senna tora TaxID=362788 RepID=A0A834TJH2_9FABA|nr:U3 small nucleolar RNA-associated protein 18-like protein [Senna tora]
MVKSVTSSVNTSGVFVTRIPFSLHLFKSIESTPTLKLYMISSLGKALMSSASASAFLTTTRMEWVIPEAEEVEALIKLLLEVGEHWPEHEHADGFHVGRIRVRDLRVIRVQDYGGALAEGSRVRVCLKNEVKKSKREEETSEPSFVEGVEGGKESEIDTLKTKRRRKGSKEDKLQMEQVKEMKKLESFLFGSLYSPIEFGKGDDNVQPGTIKDSDLFFTDHSANSVLSVHEEDADYSEESEDESQRKPAWVDDEEERTAVNIANVNRLRKLRKEEDESLITGSEYVSRVRAQHEKLNPGTDWAKLDSRSRIDKFSDDESTDEENDVVVSHGYKDVDDILKTNEDLVVKSSSKLLPGVLEYSKLVNANVQDPSKAPINSVQFHRNGQLLLAAGLDRRLRFFQIDGKRNTKIQSIFIDDCPIRKASFLPDGSHVIISGRRKFFYSFDLVKAKVDKIGPLVGREEKSLEVFEVSPDSRTLAFVGNEGYILLVSTKTKELIGTLKMNGTARCLAFAEDGQQLLSSGGDGQVYHWDLRTRTCIHKGIDEGCINSTALSTSPGGALFAAGSDSGIVNIYNRDEFLGGKKKPIKTIENLTTKVDFMRFNNDSQILAICSGMKKSSLKLIHIPSYTVFSNWPPPNKSLGHPLSLDFSPGGGFMAVGNAAGKVLLYKLHHYQHA